MATGAAAGTALLAGGGAAWAQEEPLKIGFVYVSPIGDAGWTYQHDLGRRAIEETFGDRIETNYVESVPEGADAERIIRELAATGHGLVFTTSFGYMNPTIKVARQFPQVRFEHCTGYKTAPNVGTYMGRFYEGRYLAGLVAGRTTQSGVIGYVGAFPIPEVVRGINAFTRGVRSVRPDAEVRVVWVSAWYDPGKEREAAETLISQGADIVTHHTDSTAIVQAAADRGVHAIAYHSDMSSYGPEAHLTASIHDWRDYYRRRVEAALAGEWETHAIWHGVAEGMVDLAPYGPAVPDEVRAFVDERKAAIADATLHPFAGPVTDREGTVRVPEGETMSDEAMLKFDWFVEGVQGTLPD